jgi:hypothetical protein
MQKTSETTKKQKKRAAGFPTTHLKYVSELFKLPQKATTLFLHLQSRNQIRRLAE